MSGIHLQPIGILSSPYKEKFAVPRQPGLVEDGFGELLLHPPFNQPEAVRGLSDFSHIWLIFLFHQTMQGGWRPTVRPPRLGGNTRVGVFATRSTFRPNPIGMSLVELREVLCDNGQVILKLGSLDLVDGTPILDIKPYLPYIESQPKARAGFAQEPPTAALTVSFTPQVQRCLAQHAQHYPYLGRFITQLLAQDPRPAYRKGENSESCYAVRLLEFNIRWRMLGEHAEVYAIEKS